MDIRVAISKDFGRYPALHDVALDIRSGELLALLGPVGLGQDDAAAHHRGAREARPTGEVFFGGEDVTDLHRAGAERRLRLPALCAVPPHDVADNIAFGLKVRPRRQRPPSAEIKRRASRAARPRPARRPRTSATRRSSPAASASAWRSPARWRSSRRVLLLDEPFGALDARCARELRRWLREIHDRTGHTTVFVTHDQEEALELADRVVVMSQGRIEQVGTPDEIYDTAESPFVFGFIGEFEPLPVRVEDGQVWIADRPIGHARRGDDPATARRCSISGRTTSSCWTAAAAVSPARSPSRRVAGTRRVELEIGGEPPEGRDRNAPPSRRRREEADRVPAEKVETVPARRDRSGDAGGCPPSVAPDEIGLVYDPRPRPGCRTAAASGLLGRAAQRSAASAGRDSAGRRPRRAASISVRSITSRCAWLPPKRCAIAAQRPQQTHGLAHSRHRRTPGWPAPAAGRPRA